MVVDNKITFFGKTDGISVEQLIRYGKFNMKVKHFHNQYEIFYIIEGQRQFFLNNKVYDAFAGDIAVIDTNLVHTTRSVGDEDSGYNRVILYIDYERMCMYDDKYPDLHLVDFFHKNYGVYHLDDEQRAIFLNLYRDLRHELTKKKYGYKTRIEINVLHWLINFMNIKSDKSNLAPPINDVKGEIASKTAAYIENNFTSNVSLDTLSEKMYLSKYYICRVFKEYTGFTVIEYTNMIRIKKAAQMLENTNESISDIATDLGYESMTYFERVFKKILNVSPLKYRKTHHSVTYGEKELNILDDSDYI